MSLKVQELINADDAGFALIIEQHYLRLGELGRKVLCRFAEAKGPLSVGTLYFVQFRLT